MNIDILQNIVKEKENLKKVDLNFKKSSFISNLIFLLFFIAFFFELCFLYPLLTYIITNNPIFTLLIFWISFLTQIIIFVKFEKMNISGYIIEKFLSSYSKVNKENELYTIFQSNLYNNKKINDIKNYYKSLTKNEQESLAQFGRG